MTFYFDPSGNAQMPNVFSVVAPLYNDPHVQVFDTAVAIKFQRSVSVASLLNSTVTLQTNEATPQTIPNAFAPFNNGNYNTLSKILTLNFLRGVQAATSYTLTITGVTDAVGNALPPFVYHFSTNAATVLESAPADEPLYIEDHSILTNLATDLNAIIQPNPAFYLTNTTPDNQSDIVVPINYRNGVISVSFNVLPDSTYISTTYFQLQCRPIARGMNPWQTVTAAVITVSGNTVNISVPSLQDATPVISIPITDPYFNYYNDALGNYGDAYVNAPYPTDIFYGYGAPIPMFWMDGYKYRLKISGAVGYTDQYGNFNPLGSDQYIRFLVDPQPMVLDPEEFYPLFPQASPYEIAELVAQHSQEAQNILKVLMTDTLAGLMDRDAIIAQTVQDFVQAATCCALSRIYDVLSGAGQGAVTIGDLTYSFNRMIKDSVNRSNAQTWCELAAVVRNELYQLSKKSGMRDVYRGAKRHNPMPERQIHHVEWNDWSVYSKPGS
jgi:hypothetical protein